MTETSQMFDPKVIRKEDHVRSTTSRNYQEKGDSHNRMGFSIHLEDGYEVEYVWIPKETHTTEAISVTLHPHKTMELVIFGTAAQLQDLARAISAAVAAGWAEANPKPVFVERDPRTGATTGASIILENPASAINRA